MRFSMKAFIISLTLAFSSLSLADWTLQQPSNIQFLTSKNTHITEIQSFKKFDAFINNSGLAKFTIDLASIDTLIGIRNQRTKEHLFEISSFSQAGFEAEIPATIFNKVKSGQQIRFELKGKISLNGGQTPAHCQVMISPSEDNTITVTNVRPILIDAGSFNLIARINKLHELAGLKSIAYYRAPDFQPFI
jgi:hypothetical protein